LKESVNSTISNSHKDFKAELENFIASADREVRALTSLEKETEKRYANFEQVL